MDKKEIFNQAAEKIRESRMTSFMVAETGDNMIGIAYGGPGGELMEAISQGLAKLARSTGDGRFATMMLVEIFKSAIQQLGEDGVTIVEISPEDQ